MNFLKRHKRVFIISLVGLCLLLIIVSALAKTKPTFLGNAIATVTSPIQSGIMGISGWISEKFEFFRGMSVLYDENQSLREENARLSARVSQLLYAETERAELERLLETKNRYSSFPYLVGQARAVDPGNWYNRFIIDIGSKDGIEVNMPVLAHGALIGRVTRVWYNAARVQSIIDDTSGVSAKVFRTNHMGTVRGDVELMMEGRCLMEFTSLEVDVAVDDEIQTSQLSSYYPPGITIGHVVSVSRDARGITTAIIQPVADFSLVDYVLVITKLYELEYEE